jgi:hypothetical protein
MSELSDSRGRGGGHAAQHLDPVTLARAGAGAALRLNASAWRLVPGPGRVVAGALDLLARIVSPDHEREHFEALRDRRAELERHRPAPPRDEVAPAAPPAPADVAPPPPTTPPVTEAGRRRAHRVPDKEADLGRAEAARIRAERRQLEDDPPDAAYTAGPRRDPGPELRVAEPWDGYEEMSAADIVRRLRDVPPAVGGIVELYERQHRARATVITAAEKAQRRDGAQTS